MRKTVLKSLSVVLLFIFLVSAPIHAAADARASAWFSGYGASVDVACSREHVHSFGAF